jgi:glutamate dehydrogenase
MFQLNAAAMLIQRGSLWRTAAATNRQRLANCNNAPQFLRKLTTSLNGQAAVSPPVVDADSNVPTMTTSTTPSPPPSVVVEPIDLLRHQYGSLADAGMRRRSQLSPLSTPLYTNTNTGSSTSSTIDDDPTLSRVVPFAPSSSLGSSALPSSSHQHSPTPWQATDHGNVQDVTRKALIYELIHQQTATIEKVVPWFLDNMPESYFYQVPETFRLQHVKAIAAIQDANMDLYLNLQAHVPDGRQVLTFIRPGTQPGTLLQMVQELPRTATTPLSRLHVFSSRDHTMSLNLFVYGKPHHDGGNNDNGPQLLSVEQAQYLGGPILDYWQEQQVLGSYSNSNSSSNSTSMDAAYLLRYLRHCTETYLRIGSHDPARFLSQIALVQAVAGTEGTAVRISPATDTTTTTTNSGYYWVDMAVDNSLPQVVLENMCRLLYTHDLDVTRARLDIIPVAAVEKDSEVNASGATTTLPSSSSSSVTMLRTLVTPIAGKMETPQQLQDTLDVLAHELKRAKWLDPATHDLVFERFPFLGVTRAEIITGLCAALHPVLAKVNALAYSNASIYERVLSNPRFIGHAAAIADLFLERFRPVNGEPGATSAEQQPPRWTEAEFAEACAAIAQTIVSDVEDTMASTVLLKMIDMVQHTLKTNVYMPDRYALSFRLDPACMMPPLAGTGSGAAQQQQRELPYGILFVHGRRFNGFHVRFRDIARGGMRLVTPASAEQYALESARHYDECYGLAFAQQLKNKDIPEGGSKAVVLINTHQLQGLSDTSKFFIMRKAVKAMTDAMLDLIVDTDYTRKYLVDYWGKKEVLYLGPDEQVIPEDIEWIVKRAAKRGYGTPAAFMSSKPRAG